MEDENSKSRVTFRRIMTQDKAANKTLWCHKGNQNTFLVTYWPIFIHLFLTLLKDHDWKICSTSSDHKKSRTVAWEHETPTKSVSLAANARRLADKISVHRQKYLQVFLSFMHLLFSLFEMRGVGRSTRDNNSMSRLRWIVLHVSNIGR